jgi:hypothetical protein
MLSVVALVSIIVVDEMMKMAGLSDGQARPPERKE